MARIFLSHASADRDKAAEVRGWLKEQGHEVFLSFGHGDGILPGEEWKHRLLQKLARCNALVPLISPSWNASFWCFAEWISVGVVGQTTIPVSIAPAAPESRPPHTAVVYQHQVADWTSTDPAERAKLKAALAKLTARRLTPAKAEHVSQTLTQSGSGNIGVQASDGSTVNINQPPPPPLAPTHDNITAPPLFIGREAEIVTLCDALLSNGRAAISGRGGMAGVGKTTLAREVASRLQAYFPDGLLEVDMAGLAAVPTRPEVAAAKVLQWLDPRARLPDDSASVLAAYRTSLHGKRCLILLDDAADAEQVKPLLVSAPTALLMTSRHQIKLDRVELLLLDDLSQKNARELLIAEIGPTRASESELASLAETCRGLPLALRAVGRYLSESPNTTVGWYLQSLADTFRQQKDLKPAQLDQKPNVEAILERSLDHLAVQDPALLTAFRKLGDFPASFVCIAAANLWDTDEVTAVALLDKLCRWSLVELANGRYRLHERYRFVALSTQSPKVIPERANWYVSYAWNDPERDGPEREKIVDELCAKAEAKGRVVLRDKNVLSTGDSIQIFMRKIGTGERIFVILSDKYLRSAYCMFELSEIWRNSRQDPRTFLQQVRVYSLDDADIWKTRGRLNYAAYWKKEHDEIESFVREHGLGVLGEQDHAAYRKMGLFYRDVSDILATFANILQPRSFEELVKYGFDD